MSIHDFRHDRRGVSTTVSFTLATGITVILVAGLLVSVGSVMESQERRAVDNELATIGEGLAVDLEDAARMADGLQAGDALALRIEAPVTVAGQPYTITVNGDDGRLVIETSDRARSVDLMDEIEVQSSAVSGGTIWIVAEGDAVRLQEARP